MLQVGQPYAGVIPTVKRSCCCGLHTGSIVLSFLQVFFSILFLTAHVYALSKHQEYYTNGNKCRGEEYETYCFFVRERWYNIMSIISLVAVIGSDILVIISAKIMNRSHLKLAILIQGVILLIFLPIIYTINVIELMLRKDKIFLFIDIMLESTTSVLYIYIMIVLFSYYKAMLKNEAGKQMDGTQEIN